MTASYEVLRQSAKSFTLVKRPRFARNKVDSDDARLYSQKYWLLALPIQEVRILMETRTIDLAEHFDCAMPNCQLTVKAALNKCAHLHRTGSLDQHIDSAIVLLALHVPVVQLDFTYKAQSGAGGLSCWHNQSFMSCTTSSIHYDRFDLSDWQFDRCAIWKTGLSMRTLVQMAHCCSYLSSAGPLMKRTAFCRQALVPVTFRSLMGSELSGVKIRTRRLAWEPEIPGQWLTLASQIRRRTTTGMIPQRVELTFALVESELVVETLQMCTRD